MTDSAIIIDAMDLLYSSRYNRSCLVPSNSDFTWLATCICESGLIVCRFNSHLASQLQTTVEAVSDNNGWARLSIIGQLLTKKYPDFDSHIYRYHKLSDLITALSLFETPRSSLGKGSPTEIFVQDKCRKPKSSAI
ncbi:NYN domain-containing protein [Aspergillus alliaceus]|uniref:NYN domain-containing protein n=1 Tax=Petromyces alliaceus TaxID=209559 RepID=UPI0012A48919|nr:uncharacterized protein BDW43DRAFT_298060 [Aspergillus alliaceus]KAB8236426.1 hypothetical protein BDW43DRAFT_298060 [Aspergillus alliaceus]